MVLVQSETVYMNLVKENSIIPIFLYAETYY